MISSQEPYRENTGSDGPIPLRDRAYFSQRFRQQVFARIAKAFSTRAEETGITKSKISMLIEKDKGQVNRIISLPSNLTLDTISDIALALNYEPRIILEDLNCDPRHNFSHAFYNLKTPINEQFEIKAKTFSSSYESSLRKPDMELYLNE